MTVRENEMAQLSVYYALIPLIESALAQGPHCQKLFKTMVTTGGMSSFHPGKMLRPGKAIRATGKWGGWGKRGLSGPVVVLCVSTQALVGTLST